MLLGPYFFIMKNNIDVTDVFNMQAVLYSFEQKAFHIETIGDYIKSNILATKIKTDHQYRLVGICNNYETAAELVKQITIKYKW